MGLFDFFKKKPKKVYAKTEVTKALDETLPLWNNLLGKYAQNPRVIYEKNPTEAVALATKLEVGSKRLLNGLAGAKRKSQEVDPKEMEALQNRLRIFRVKKEALGNLIATAGAASRR